VETLPLRTELVSSALSFSLLLLLWTHWTFLTS